MTEREQKSHWHDWRPEDFSEETHGKYSLDSASPFERKLLTKLFEAIENKYRFKISINPLDSLVSYSVKMREAFQVAYELKRAGVIKDISKKRVLSDEPKMFRYFATVSGAKKDGQEGLGCSFFSEAEAIWPALGEAVDRYSLIHFNPRYWVDASFERIKKDSIDIFSLAGISMERRRQGHSRYNLFFNEKTIFRWVKGYSLTKSRNVWIPLQLVTFYHWPKDREPYLRIPISTGNAAGKNVTDAIHRGMLEVIEQDAFMIAWLKKISPPRIDISQYPSERIRRIVAQFSRHGLRLLLLELPTDVPCHVVLALIIDPNQNFTFLTMGLRASLNLEEAIVVAAQEALAVRFFSRDYIPTHINEIPQVSDLEKIKRLERVLIWATRRDLESEIQFLNNGPIKTMAEIEQSISGADTNEKRLNLLVDHFKRQEIEVAYVENIPGDIRGKIPFTCAYVVIPEFQPMHLDEDLPYISGKRLMEVPLKLGYPVYENINHLPHPFP